MREWEEWMCSGWVCVDVLWCGCAVLWCVLGVDLVLVYLSGRCGCSVV